MRQGHFEELPSAGDKRVFRLNWQPAGALTEQEKNYAQFVRYLITLGRLSELVEPARS